MDRLVRAPIDGVGSIVGGRGFWVLSAGLEPVAASRGLGYCHVRVPNDPLFVRGGLGYRRGFERVIAAGWNANGGSGCRGLTR